MVHHPPPPLFAYLPAEMQLRAFNFGQRRCGRFSKWKSNHTHLEIWSSGKPTEYVSTSTRSHLYMTNKRFWTHGVSNCVMSVHAAAPLRPRPLTACFYAVLCCNYMHLNYLRPRSTAATMEMHEVSRILPSSNGVHSITINPSGTNVHYRGKLNIDRFSGTGRELI